MRYDSFMHCCLLNLNCAFFVFSLNGLRQEEVAMAISAYRISLLSISDGDMIINFHVSVRDLSSEKYAVRYCVNFPQG